MSNHEKGGRAGNNGSHKGQATASARKQALKREKQAALEREASERGISVAQLQTEKAAVVMHFQAGPRRIVTVRPPAPDPEAVTRRGGYLV